MQDYDVLGDKKTSHVELELRVDVKAYLKLVIAVLAGIPNLRDTSQRCLRLFLVHMNQSCNRCTILQNARFFRQFVSPKSR